jgi:hypothetical protein
VPISDIARCLLFGPMSAPARSVDTPLLSQLAFQEILLGIALIPIFVSGVHAQRMGAD